MKRYLHHLALLGSVVFILGCQNQSSTPLPKGYIRIGLPEPNVTALVRDELPFRLLHNEAAHWEPHSKDGWGDLVYPRLGARIEFTYLPVEDNLVQLVDDAFDLAYKHAVVSDGIERAEYHNDSSHVHGLLFKISGNAASATQWIATDSTGHFLRAASSIYATPNKDSLAPVNDFLRAEMRLMMESLTWHDGR